MAKKRSVKIAATIPSQPGTDKGEIAILGRPELDPDEPNRFLGDDFIKLSDYLYEKKVKTSTVKDNLKRFLTEIGDLVGEAPQLFGNYELHEIEISAEVSISGELKLIGLGGAEMEGKGGLKFTIRRTVGDDKKAKKSGNAEED